MGRAKLVAVHATPMIDPAEVPLADSPRELSANGRPHLQWMVNRWRAEGREQRTSHLARPYEHSAMVFPNSIGTYQTVLATQERKQAIAGVIQRVGYKLS